MFRVFGDKKTLFIRVIGWVAESFGAIDTAQIETGDFRRDIVCLCENMLGQFIRYNALFRMLLFEAKKHEDIALALKDIRSRGIANVLSLVGRYRGTGNGEQRMNRVECLGNALMGTSMSYCMFHATENEAAFIKTHAAILAGAFIDQIEKITGDGKAWT